MVDETASPRLKILNEVITALKQGQEVKDSLKEVIDIISQDLQQMLQLNQDETIFADPTSKERWDIMHQAILQYQKSLNKMNLYFQDGELKHLDEGLKKASEADSQLYSVFADMNKIYQKMKEEVEAANEVVCIYCGQKNHKDSKFCTRCKKPLTKGFQEVTEYVDVTGGKLGAAFEGIEEYVNINRIKEMVAGVSGGSIQPQELIKFLEEMKGMHKSGLGQFESLKGAESNLYPEIVDNISIAKQIIRDFVSVLDSMTTSAKSGDLGDLESLVAQIDELANQLGQVKQNFQAISQELSSQIQPEQPPEKE